MWWGGQDNIRLVPSKLWDERQMLEGQGAGEGPQSLNYAGAHLQSYRHEPETPEVRGANRETPGKYFKVLCPALGSPAQIFPSYGKAERIGIVWPGEKKALG